MLSSRSLSFLAGLALVLLPVSGMGEVSRSGASSPSAVGASGNQWGNDDSTVSSDPTPDVSFEVELNPRHMSSLMRYFDMEHLDKAVQSLRNRVLKESVVKNYLSSPAAREALAKEAPEVWAELTEGLSLPPSLVPTKPRELKVPEAAPRILGPDGKEPSTQIMVRGLEIPGRPTEEKAAGPVTRSTILVTRDGKPLEQAPVVIAGSETGNGPRNDWPLLHRRWDKLPLATKQKLVSIPLLSSLSQAQVVQNLPIDIKESRLLSTFLRPKADAPAWLKEFARSHDNWDPPTVEWSFVRKRRTPKRSLALLYLLSRYAGVDHEIDRRLELKEPEVGLHMHISFPGLPRERDIKDILESYRMLTALRLMVGAGPSVYGQLEYGSLDSLDYVRQRGRNHIEIRELTRKPAELISELEHWVSLPPEEANRLILEEANRVYASDTQLHKALANRGRVAWRDLARHLPSAKTDWENWSSWNSDRQAKTPPTLDSFRGVMVRDDIARENTAGARSGEQHIVTTSRDRTGEVSGICPEFRRLGIGERLRLIP